MKKNCDCGMPLGEDSECKCNKSKCVHCCECTDDCECGCKEKAKKESGSEKE